ncbi:hypothetical protein RRX38_19400 [Pseudomonas sp. DTU_2021_1001937_2_SI_NGA_ILE_001]|uniref:hypothetical protein n=1 Tax=Pseudomonas sp. DTU_2021_1001937_2_SI_NGA_ILE_001 TaxID=3077589 RepID=UPI0028FC2275|nr:hypothetical protein [Pseudomonas sp. DTU_2021_1001937_2_SI_NGA_ILE_001]WNW13230.1 hypothetical protein RRX38_19400 [Pseudomonas sp. DTU_2021_1001937_2_SI_NGA_ILE_001]
MNIFAVSYPAPAVRDLELVRQLSGIRFSRHITTPVIVVDDRHDLEKLEADGPGVSHVRFSLDLFISRRHLETVSMNRIARLMDLVDVDWVLVDLGHHPPAVCSDFVHKLARYNFLNTGLRQCNLVFLMPGLLLCANARLLNETFNNRPGRGDAAFQARQLRRLFLVTDVQRVPWLSACVRRLKARCPGLFRRLLGGG